MNKIIPIVFAMVGAIVATGCASSRAFFIDRGRDALDVASVAVEKNSLGFTLQAGPLLTGLNLPILEKEYCKGYGLRAGSLGAYDYLDVQAILFGLKYYESPHSYPRKTKTESTQVLMLSTGRSLFAAYERPSADSYGSVELSASLGVGVRFGIHYFEIADLLAGWIGFDLLDDDMQMKGMKHGSIRPAQATGAPAADL